MMSNGRRLACYAAAVLVASTVLQGCGDTTDLYDQWSKVTNKALDQAQGFADSAKQHAASALVSAKKASAGLMEEGAKVAEELKKKAEAAQAAAKVKMEELKKKGGKAYAAAQVKYEEAKKDGAEMIAKGKVKLEEAKAAAAKKLEEGKALAADLTQKAKDAAKAVTDTKALKKIRDGAMEAYQKANSKMQSAKYVAAEKLKVAQAAFDKAKEGSSAFDQAKKAVADAKAGLTNLVGQDKLDELKKLHVAAEDKFDESLDKAKKFAVDAKTQAVAEGADERLFVLIPDDIDMAPGSNGAMYYAGLASLAVVSISFGAIALRKFTNNRRALAREENIESGLE